MVNKRLFDRRYGKGAFALLRSMLADPTVTYERIAENLGLTKQRIGQLAKDFGVDGRQREYERIVRREPRVINKEYLPDIRAVVDKIRRSGIEVIPCDLLHSDHRAWRSQRIVFVNGVSCSIQLRKAHKLRPNGRHYARFDVNDATKRAKVALWAMRSGRVMRVYVIPLSHLRKISSVYIPVEGKYAVSNNNKPRKDWTRYEEAWHLLDSATRAAL